jgi:hypothetical protein
MKKTATDKFTLIIRHHFLPEIDISVSRVLVADHIAVLEPVDSGRLKLQCEIRLVLVLLQNDSLQIIVDRARALNHCFLPFIGQSRINSADMKLIVRDPKSINLSGNVLRLFLAFLLGDILQGVSSWQAFVGDYRALVGDYLRPYAIVTTGRRIVSHKFILSMNST